MAGCASLVDGRMCLKAHPAIDQTAYSVNFIGYYCRGTSQCTVQKT